MTPVAGRTAVLLLLIVSAAFLIAQPESGDETTIDVTSFRYRREVPPASGLVAVRLDAAVLAHSQGPGVRFADVRVVDTAGRQIPYVLERRAAPHSLDLTLARTQPRSRELLRDDGRRRTAYAVRLPFSGLPSASLALDTSERLFKRTVRVGVERDPDRRHREAWFDEIAVSSWAHTDDSMPASITLTLGTLDDPELVLAMEEGDNQPLPITRARLLLPDYRLRFYHPGEPVEIVYGRDDLRVPRYDLALRESSVLGEDATEIDLGEERAREGFSEGEALISPEWFWGGLSLAALVLVGLIVHLMRGAKGS